MFYFHDNKLGFTIGVPSGNNQEARRLLDRNMKKLHSFKNTVSFNDTTLFHVVDTYIVRRKGEKGGKDRKFSVAAHIYLNKPERSRLENELIELLTGIMTEFTRCSFDNLTEATEWLEATVGKAKSGLFNVRKALP
ncbi:MAG: hypothetical protein PHV82_17565 [Victivallaceae bacterium]|nr:hypothetical protein [Victivallaceae bacterium]